MMSAVYTRHPAVPFASLVGLRRQLDGMLNDSSPLLSGACHLPVDVVESGDELRFELDVPGMRAEDIEVTIEDGILAVSGEKVRVRAADASAQETYRLAERQVGRFTRRFRLPRTVDSTRIQASCEHGVLTIRVPRAEAARARRIEVA